MHVKVKSISALLHSRVSILIVLNLIVFVGLSLLRSSRFLDWENLKAIFSLMTYDLLLACGMTFILILGGIDLSVGGQVALGSVIVALLLRGGSPVFIALLVGLMATLCIGGCNAFLITRFKLAPFLVTLGTMSIARGLAKVLTEGQFISFPNASEWFVKFGRAELGINGVGLPVIFLLAVLVIVVFTLFLQKWYPLNQAFLIGSNPEAARLSGMKSKKMIAVGYLVSSAFCFLTMTFMTASNRIGYASYADGYEMTAIAAAVVGGASMFGGFGSVLGSCMGVLLLALINNGFVMLNGDPNWQQAMTGIILIVAIAFDVLTNRGKRK